MRTRKLIARNAHAITRCARVIRVRKSAHLNGIMRTFLPGNLYLLSFSFFFENSWLAWSLVHFELEKQEI